MSVITQPVVRSVNPATGEVIAEYPTSTAEQVDAALTRARTAHRALGATALEERAELLRRIGRELASRREVLAHLITEEMGKVITEARGEIDKCVWACEYYAQNGARQLAPEPVATEWTDTYVEFPPLGVVLAIMPWNYPVWQLIRAAAPAWMAGNAVVLKHASNVTGCALELGRAVAQAAGELSPLEVIVAPGSRVAEVIADHRVAAVTLTGSESVGVQVAEASARHLKKSVLELGGSDAFIVLSDADLEAAVRGAISARFLNAGQSCIAGKRFIVVEAVADAFTEAFAAAAQALQMGDPLDERNNLGPMARVDLRDDLDRQVRRGLEDGGRLIVGGTHPEGPGAYFTPTVVADVPPDGVLAQEETFGPAAAILRAPDEASAIVLANRSPYGLSSSLWTADLDRARRLAPEIEAGAVFVNTFSASDPRMPFGGIKRSGWGRELGPFGIREFVNVQAVTIAPRAA
ncbi:MAG TPA: NAD-dependent succinate-semialdehyde dehydrogenase [Solirubrobacteraceae bacterium]|nr:NAD-dependent succinate-semialdehyde dehydrogenase [Solirubrobacteraceae bacterium]